jgi:hypothetical protein
MSITLVFEKRMVQKSQKFFIKIADPQRCNQRDNCPHRRITRESSRYRFIARSFYFGRAFLRAFSKSLNRGRCVHRQKSIRSEINLRIIIK